MTFPDGLSVACSGEPSFLRHTVLAGMIVVNARFRAQKCKSPVEETGPHLARGQEKSFVVARLSQNLQAESTQKRVFLCMAELCRYVATFRPVSPEDACSQVTLRVRLMRHIHRNSTLFPAISGVRTGLAH